MTKIKMIIIIIYNNKLNNNKIIASKFFNIKTKIIGSTSDNGNRLNAEVVLP